MTTFQTISPTVEDTDVHDEFTIALADLILEMQAEGYACRAPSDEVAKLDREIVSGKKCRRCGAEYATHYEPFTLYDEAGRKMSYRAFTVCKTCGQVREF